MNIKSATVFALIFTIQLISSCVVCNCPDPMTYDVIYESIDVTPWNTSGFNETQVTDTVYRNAFGLTLVVNFDTKEVACERVGAGFLSAMACSCVGDEYRFVDPVAKAEIFVTDVATNMETDVTSFFKTYGYDGELISLDELFEIKQEWHDGFQFELVEFDLIPSSAVFTVNVFLESGMKFSEQTQQVNFYD